MRKNEIIILFFVQQKCKHCAMAFLMSRSASKHALFALDVDRTAGDAVKARVLTYSQSASKHGLFALGVNRTAGDAVKAGVPTYSLVSYTGFAASCETSIHSCSLAT